jgi:hypothetical protein
MRGTPGSVRPLREFRPPVEYDSDRHVREVLAKKVIVGDSLYFDIVHQDWGESDPPTFDRNIVAQVDRPARVVRV